MTRSLGTGMCLGLADWRRKLNSVKPNELPIKMNYVNKLKELAGQLDFVERPEASDWAAIEQTLRFPLPIDYKQLVEHFGSGTFGGNLDMFNPIGSTDSIEELTEFGKSIRDGLRDRSFKFYPEEDGMILVSYTGTRVNLYYKPLESDWQLVWYDNDYEEIIDVPYSLSEYLYKSRIGDVEESLREFSKDIWFHGPDPIFVPKRIRRREGPPESFD